jgi:hypothetical protein
MWRNENPELRWDWNKIDTADIDVPPEFLWGVATAAHQAEGECDNNNWSEWEKAHDENGKPRIKNNQKAGLACDHWKRYQEDILLMQEFGVKAYRFSVKSAKRYFRPCKTRFGFGARSTSLRSLRPKVIS